MTGKQIERLRTVECIHTTMDEDQFFGVIEEKFRGLHDSDTESFTETYELELEGSELEVEGIRHDSDRWGENKYAVDGSVWFRVEDESDWEDIEERVDELCRRLKNLLSETIGFSGPVIVRSGDDKTERMWSRRIIHDKEDQPDINSE